MFKRLALLFGLVCLSALVDSCLRTSPPIGSTTVAPPTVTTRRTTRNPTSGTTTTSRTTVTTTMTTTTAVPTCTAPAGSAGLIIDTGVQTMDTTMEQMANSHCTSCQAGNRNFYTCSNGQDPIQVGASMQIALTVICQTQMLCVCNAAGVCCQPATAADIPGDIKLMPSNSGGTCKMNLVIEGNALSTTFTCSNGNMITQGMQYDMTGATYLPFSSAGAYFNADSVSCGGCNNIRNDVCRGPRLNGPA